MREAFRQALMAHAARPDFIFLTGDLGFQALEPLRDAMADRFINAGVAEQNMINVAAGLAQSGLRPWVYSIAPFLYARPFEQIRNDIARPNLPVTLAGNGGGYGYGVMGSTHHALEDYGVLLTLPHLRVFIPAFDSDLSSIVDKLIESTHPSYLRLGFDEFPGQFQSLEYGCWRKLVAGNRATILVAGPLVGSIAAEALRLPASERPSIWLLSELPWVDIPSAFLQDVEASGHLVVVEEHVKNGGVGQMISHSLMVKSVPVRRFTHHYAQGYVSGLHGSQKFHRKESGLDAASVLTTCSSAG